MLCESKGLSGGIQADELGRAPNLIDVGYQLSPLKSNHKFRNPRLFDSGEFTMSLPISPQASTSSRLQVMPFTEKILIKNEDQE